MNLEPDENELPPDVQELAETMLNGGTPVYRTAAEGVEQMRTILLKLRADKLRLLNTLEDVEPELNGEAHRATLLDDLDELNREIADYQGRLAEYETQQGGLN